MNGLLIYLLIGLAFGLLIEIFWPKIKEEGEIEEELNMPERLILVLGWPFVVFIALLYCFADDGGDDNMTFGGAH